MTDNNDNKPIINYRINNLRFNHKKGLLFVNMTKTTKEFYTYERKSVNIQLDTKDMTKLYNYLDNMKAKLL